MGSTKTTTRTTATTTTANTRTTITMKTTYEVMGDEHDCTFGYEDAKLGGDGEDAANNNDGLNEDDDDRYAEHIYGRRRRA